MKIGAFFMAMSIVQEPDGTITIREPLEAVEFRPPADDPDAPVFLVHWPDCWVFSMIDCTAADGFTHTVRLRVMDSQGLEIALTNRSSKTGAVMRFLETRPGRPRRMVQMDELRGCVLKCPASYTCDLMVDDVPQASFSFYADASRNRRP